MTFTYALTNDGIPPKGESVRLVIEVTGPYPHVLRVLDAARIEDHSIAVEEEQKLFNEAFRK